MKYFILIFSVLLLACSDANDVEPIFFDFEAFIDQEVERLANAPIHLQKHFEFGDQSEDTLLESDIDWAKELEPFKVNLNKPAWITEAQIDSNSINFAPNAIRYSFNSEKIPYKEVVMIYEDEQFKTLREFLIVYQSNNYLYNAEKELSYHVKDGFRIYGIHDVQVFDNKYFRIEAKFVQ